MQARAATLGENPERASWFGNTDWWVVTEASRPAEIGASAAQSQFCQTYWKPAFRYVRSLGFGWHDAEDLTQDFFVGLLNSNSLRTASSEKGKFRSFLLTLLKRFLADQRDRRNCQKRGGGVEIFSLDAEPSDGCGRVDPAFYANPGVLYERRWAESVFLDALAELQRECVSVGKGRIFEAVEDLITGESSARAADVAAKLQTTETNVRVTVHRLRLRLRHLLARAMADSAEASTGAKR